MPDPALSIEVLAAIDAVCDRFERAWREVPIGVEGPACEDFVVDLPSAAREAALGELFLVERQYRGARGETDAAWASGRPAIEALASAPPDKAETLLCCPQCNRQVEPLPNGGSGQVTCKACGSCLELPREAALVAARPQQIGRFLLREQLGVGGFGVVWRARDPQLDRDVALKSPRRGQLTRHETEMFFREARTAAQLTHPGIVSIHEVGRDLDSPGGTIYLVIELVDGEPLSDYLKAHRVTHRQAAALVADLADALEYAHSRGVIHRDLKPSNIMLDRFASGGETAKHAGVGFGRPRLMDFGLAKRDAGEATLTLDGQVLGTPAYMSPEQARGEIRWVDHRTDLYALGVVLFHLLTGELPFRGTASSQIQQRLTDDAPSPRRIDDTVPLDLANVCAKCLQREPGGRYASAVEVAEEMRRYLAGEPVLARPLSWTGRAGRWVRRRPAAATALVLGAVLAVAGPAAAIRIHYANQSLLEKDQTNRDLIQRQERKIDELAAAVDGRQQGPVLDASVGRRPHQAELVERLIAKHHEGILTAARASPADSAVGIDARLAAARLLIAGGDADQALTLLAEIGSTEADPDRPTAVALRAVLAEIGADRQDRLANPRSADQPTAESRLRATADRQRRLDQLLASPTLGPEDLAAIASALLGSASESTADE